MATPIPPVIDPKAAAELARQAAEAAQAYAQLAADVAGAAAAGAASHGLGGVDPFVFRFSIFVLAVCVGYYVVWAVTPALHTPLMSVTNAISSVIVVGALLAVGVTLAGDDSGTWWARAFGFVALILASVNIFGGFLVTQRMLGMYKKKS
jgi:NAD(P) transhydrogenase subunit alpha